MKKIILAVFLAVVVILAGSFFLMKNKNVSQFKIFGSSLEALANNGVIVEVIAGQVTVNLGGQEKVLSAPLNQEIDKEAILTTAAASQANIIFPSGSSARLDENTTVKLADFSDSDQSVGIKLRLESGNLWSRVQRLADKETNYEVETSNTVAVVKGTSFNIFYKNGKTRLEVLANAVALKALDPVTRQVLSGGEINVEAGNFVEADQQVPPTTEQPLQSATIAPQDLEKSWLKDNLAKDKKTDEMILRATGGSSPTKEVVKQIILPAVIILQQETLSKESITQIKSAQKTEEPTPLPSSVLPTPEISASATPASSQIPSATPKPSVSVAPKITNTPSPVATVQMVKLSVLSIRPKSAPGPSYQYTKVTIKGTGFNAQTRASVGSYILDSLRVIDAQTLEGIAPAKMKVGKYDVILTDGTGRVVLPGGFEVVQANEGAG